MRVVLLIFGRFLSPVKEGAMLAPWNLSSACLWGRNDRISVECLNLVHQGGVIPLGFTPWNAEQISLGHPMGRGVREYKGGSRFALIYMN